ncbi:cystathionine beta-lyase/cystathionine gamma-synthase [Salsuginibacillus halophilus]|uniref:homocysteine desulfhydrase n=1 Tax=Salsuginibacillus halophilus TaxID=517424 RepID=A0A2P8HL28_9BACI|nr:aminotransferase class I/II-fold pyridoxal phosphate-dependent enzyme [Salsuginibacillus halophilus]PSL46927.1 cystathionine beta-lyase/cystathionine gamma-synthase [Salsuginibacillus halophilus]
MTPSFDTSIIHGREPKAKQGSKSQPIYQTSAYSFTSLEDMEGFFQQEHDYLYTRYGNPNTDELGELTAAAEGMPAGASASSGMSAILAGVLATVSPGEHLVAPEDVYGGTFQMLENHLQAWGIEVTFVSFDTPGALEAAIQPNTAMVYAESVTNPLLRVEDLSYLNEIKQKHNLYLFVDNTFATPYFLKPAEAGADLVVHSATKYLGGHSDVTAGVLAGTAPLIAEAKAKIIQLGLNLSPFEAWLAVRGVKTLSVRMARQAENAARLTEALNKTDINAVYYPQELSSHGNGAVVTIDLGANYDVSRFFSSLDWVKIVATLAGVETTVSYPLGTSHRSVPEDLRSRLGINAQVVRISVGLEDAEDIIAVFQQALKASTI